MGFRIFYAEDLSGPREEWESKRGVFMSIEEFAPYRRDGWTAGAIIDARTDALLRQQEIDAADPAVRLGFREGKQMNRKELVTSALKNALNAIHAEDILGAEMLIGDAIFILNSSYEEIKIAAREAIRSQILEEGFDDASMD